MLNGQLNDSHDLFLKFLNEASVNIPFKFLTCEIFSFTRSLKLKNVY